MPFNTTPEDWAKDPSIEPILFDMFNDGPLLDFVVSEWEDALQPCIDEIVRLDNDNESYIAKLMEPFILNYKHSMFDGTYVGAALLHWLVHTGSSTIIGLEQNIWSISMPQQTEF